MTRLEAERDHVVRELHDLAAHAVAQIAVQAAALDASGDGAPAVAAIRQAAGSAMRDLRRVDTLLDAAAPPPYGPQPDLAAIARLLDDLRARGLAAAVELDATDGPVPPCLALAGYRVLEHLVTTLAPLTGLVVCAAPHLLTVDARVATGTPPGAAVALAAERARLHGGTLTLTGDGCRVRIPLGD